MKFLLTFACVAIYMATINSVQASDDLKAQLHAVWNKCVAEVPDLKPEHLEKLKKNDFVEGVENLKKFAFCLEFTTQMLDEAGAFNAEMAKARFGAMYGHHDYDKKVDECTKTDHHNALDNAWQLITCVNPDMGKSGLFS